MTGATRAVDLAVAEAIIERATRRLDAIEFDLRLQPWPALYQLLRLDSVLPTADPPRPVKVIRLARLSWWRRLRAWLSAQSGSLPIARVGQRSSTDISISERTAP